MLVSTYPENVGDQNRALRDWSTSNVPLMMSVYWEPEPLNVRRRWLNWASTKKFGLRILV